MTHSFSRSTRRPSPRAYPAAREIRADSWAPSIRVARTRSAYPPGIPPLDFPDTPPTSGVARTRKRLPDRGSFRRGDFADFHQRFSLVPRRCAGKYPPAAREIRADSWAPSIRVARTRSAYPPGIPPLDFPDTPPTSGVARTRKRLPGPPPRTFQSNGWGPFLMLLVAARSQGIRWQIWVAMPPWRNDG